VLQITDLVKTFGSLRANDGISFSVLPGRIHALLGENGAGKSTLVKSLYGVHKPDSGTIHYDGRELRIDSPARARSHGIGMVFQDMRLIPAMTVWENIALYLSDTPVILRRRELRARISELSGRYGLAVDPDRLVQDLSIGEWQRVELVKVLLGGVRILILDEPTSVLTPAEVEGLFEVVKKLAADQVAVIIITHKLDEIRRIADQVTVLRRGRTVLHDCDPGTLSDSELIQAMVGEPVDPLQRQAARPCGHDPVMSLARVSVRRPDQAMGLQAVTLAAYPGQILGVAGVAGSGQAELADTFLGLASLEAGNVQLGRAGLDLPNSAAPRKAQVMAIPADPVRQFVVPRMTVEEHVRLWNRQYGQPAGLDLAAREAIARLHTAEPNRRMESLSGGNIQRVVLTLALTSNPKLLIACYPTRGLDALTTDRTRTLLRELAQDGSAVVLISEDLDELITLADRIAVLASGRVAGVLEGDGVDRAKIGELMASRLAA
jgi:simple sugar transport system ATP-binding protein